MTDRYFDLIEKEYAIPDLPISTKHLLSILESKNLDDMTPVITDDMVFMLKVFSSINSFFFRYYIESINSINHICDITNNSMRNSQNIKSLVFDKPAEPPEKLIRIIGADGIRAITVSSADMPLNNRFYYAVHRHSSLLAKFMLFLIHGLEHPFFIKYKYELFYGALFHDIGKLSLYISFKYKYKNAFGYTGEAWNKAEKDVIGFDHRDIGEYIAVKLNLPTYIRYFIKYHCKEDVPKEAQNDEKILIRFFRNVHSIFIGKQPLAKDLDIVRDILKFDPEKIISLLYIDFNDLRSVLK